MRAVWYERFGPAEEVLTAGDLPNPEPAAGEVLVRVRASGINPSDVKLRAGARPGACRVRAGMAASSVTASTD